MQIIKLKPEVVIIEKGLNDLVAHYLSKVNINATCKVRKINNYHVTPTCKGTSVNNLEELHDIVMFV